MRKIGLVLAGAFLFALASCGGNSEKKASAEPKKEETKAEVKQEVKKEEAAAPAADVDGKTVFTSNGCIACHQLDKKTTGPALKEIAKGYDGKKEDMLKFLKGEGEAIIDPPQFAVMKPNLEITKKMADNELSALADYILSQK